MSFWQICRSQIARIEGQDLQVDRGCQIGVEPSRPPSAAV
jgi:hypothetical protein